MIRITGGEAKGRKLKSPTGFFIRPTLGRIRKTLFDTLQEKIVDSLFLDLFAGTGVVGIEAISRGACYAVFIEKSKKAAAIIKENLAICRFQKRAKLIVADVMKAHGFLRKENLGFDIIFAAPPYSFANIEEVVHIYLPFLKKKGTMVVQYQKPLYIALNKDFEVKIKRIAEHYLTFIEER